MSHYYLNDDALKHENNIITYTYKGKNIVLKSDSGIFSKERIDFGTNLLINNIEINGTNILDIGCGYGAIGVILGVSNPQINLTLSDVNTRALKAATDNCLKNNIKKYQIIESDGYNNLKETYDMIVSNPPIRAGKEVVYRIVLEGVKHLNKGGIIYVVIQKKQGALSLIEKMKETYNSTEIIVKEKGYYIIKSKK